MDNTTDKVLIWLGIISFIIGRIFDDINRYKIQGVNPKVFEGLSLASLALSAILICCLRLKRAQKFSCR